MSVLDVTAILSGKSYIMKGFAGLITTFNRWLIFSIRISLDGSLHEVSRFTDPEQAPDGIIGDQAGRLWFIEAGGEWAITSDGRVSEFPSRATKLAPKPLLGDICSA